MEILSDVIFRGNVNAKGTLSFTTPKTDLCDSDHGTYIDASEFSFGGGKLYYGKFGSQQCTMVVASPGIGVCGIIITGDIRVNSKIMKIVDERTDGTSNDHYEFPNSSTEFFRCVGDNRLLVSNQLNEILYEYDSIVFGNPEIPANCTRFIFHDPNHESFVDVKMNSKIGLPNFKIPSVQVWRNSMTNPKIVQMEVEMVKKDSDTSNFIGNISDHSDNIPFTEFILVIRK